MAEATFYIDGATSPQPIARIERLLSGLDGVERSLVDTEDGEVKIQFDEKKISEECIVLTLQQHGFRFQ
ncbi:heavy-metal-associated domain-containing protein [Geobacillus sp. Y412MC52]|uniref:heavy-metal-associated domain-containing protein n=1 Tax=Geobacillus sp. (strain Y412MC52) TaxID=550542 RepID=UPI00018C0A69|nr:heavy metal-associated domain-containing protein [Geobacillus sp. Y412MC52]ADU94129.1 heavy-metal cation transporting ATPase [Geobacillus sp. Y412MC52]ALA71809.1 metal ABC transporter ATPase [Geobacillus stearothermophilus 10]